MGRKNKNRDQSAQSRAYLPGYMKPVYDRVFDKIVHAIEQGSNIDSLREHFSAHVLNRAFARLQSVNPEQAMQAMGAPASDHHIMLDECLGFGLVTSVHALFGRVSAARMEFPARTKDTYLFPELTRRGVRAIITNDGAHHSPKDLCNIARMAYRSGDQNIRYPGVIVMPQRTEDGLYVLSCNRRFVRDYLDLPQPDDIMDLRNA